MASQFVHPLTANQPTPTRATFAVPPPPSFSIPSSSPPPYIAEPPKVVKKSGLSRWFRYPLILLALFVSLLSLISMALSASTLRTYNDTKSTSSEFLPLWPAQLRIAPTSSSIACSAIILLFSILNICTLIHPKIRSLTAVLTTLFSALSLLLTLPPLILTANTSATGPMSYEEFPYLTVTVSDETPTGVHSIASWSCKWSNVAPGVTPVNYRSLCTSSRAAWGLLIILLITELLATLLSTCGLVRSRKPRQIEEEEEMGKEMN